MHTAFLTFKSIFLIRRKVKWSGMYKCSKRNFYFSLLNSSALTRRLTFTLKWRHEVPSISSFCYIYSSPGGVGRLLGFSPELVGW